MASSFSNLCKQQTGNHVTDADANLQKNINLAKTVHLITVTRLLGCTITRSTKHNNSNRIFLQKVLYNHDLYVIAAAVKLFAEPAA